MAQMLILQHPDSKQHDVFWEKAAVHNERQQEKIACSWPVRTSRIDTTAKEKVDKSPVLLWAFPLLQSLSSSRAWSPEIVFIAFLIALSASLAPCLPLDRLLRLFVAKFESHGTKPACQHSSFICVFSSSTAEIHRLLVSMQIRAQDIAEARNRSTKSHDKYPKWDSFYCCFLWKICREFQINTDGHHFEEDDCLLLTQGPLHKQVHWPFSAWSSKPDFSGESEPEVSHASSSPTLQRIVFCMSKNHISLDYSS